MLSVLTLTHEKQSESHWGGLLDATLALDAALWEKEKLIGTIGQRISRGKSPGERRD